MAGYDDDLRFAHVLADAADDITMRRFRALDLRVESKPDLTPVTDADVAAEESLRNVLSRARPRDAVLGEEFGRTGTGQAMLGDRPDRRHPELRPRRTGLGHADRPDGRRRGGGRGGLRAGARPAVVGGPGRRRVDRAQPDQGVRLSCLRGNQPGGRIAVLLRPVRLGAAGKLAGFLSLAQSVWRTRAYGDFWSHVLVAEGAVDISAEPEVSLWDLAALQIIVEEAGGIFTDLAGKPTPDGGSVVCTNAHLHSEVLGLLASG